MLLVMLFAGGARAEKMPEPAMQDEAWHQRHSKKLAAGGVAALYAGFVTYAYFAWFKDTGGEEFHFEDSKFGNGYAGGADKLGHLWATHALSRMTTSVLVAGGFERLPSSLIASGISLSLFTLSEFEDGYRYGFEVADQLANTAGAALSVLMVNVPEVDELFDVRLEYLPSSRYRQSFDREGNIDIAQDYDGQSYLLALHLAAIPGLSDPDWMRWTRFTDLAVGYEVRWPDSDAEDQRRRQSLYAGVAVNMQQVLAALFDDSAGRRLGQGTFEFLSVPYTTLRLGDLERRP